MVAALAGAVGFVAASWNGIVMAEVARLAPLEKVAVATSGSTVFLFLGYVAGPAAFSVLVTMTGSWRLAFLLTAGQLAVFAVAQTVWLLSRYTAPAKRGWAAKRTDAVGSRSEPTVASRVRGQRADPITLTLGASHLDLSRSAGEVYRSGREATQ